MKQLQDNEVMRLIVIPANNMNDDVLLLRCYASFRLVRYRKDCPRTGLHILQVRALPLVLRVLFEERACQEVLTTRMSHPSPELHVFRKRGRNNLALYCARGIIASPSALRRSEEHTSELQ